MRRMLVPLLALALACGGADAIAAPQKGTAKFTRDANTCTGPSVSFDFFLDGASLGSAPLIAGGGMSYSVAAGGHTFSAKVSNTTVSFSTINGTVPAGGTFTYTIVCA